MQPNVRENNIQCWSQVQSFTYRKHCQAFGAVITFCQKMRDGFWFIALLAEAILILSCRSTVTLVYIGAAAESARTRQTNTDSDVHEHTSRACSCQQQRRHVYNQLCSIHVEMMPPILAFVVIFSTHRNAQRKDAACCYACSVVCLSVCHDREPYKNR